MKALHSPTAMERRKVQRFNLGLETMLYAYNTSMYDHSHVLLSSNISSSGVFLLTGEPLPLNTRVNLGFILPRGNDPEYKDNREFMINCSGTVVRTTAEGMAISFDKKCQIRTGEVLSEHLV